MIISKHELVYLLSLRKRNTSCRSIATFFKEKKQWYKLLDEKCQLDVLTTPQLHVGDSRCLGIGDYFVNDQVVVIRSFGGGWEQ